MDKANTIGANPLNVAACRGYLKVVELLLEHGADLDKARSNDGWTPLHTAANNNHTEVVTCLMNWSASLTSRANDGRRPIDAAVKQNIKQLLRDEENCRGNRNLKRAIIPSPVAESKRPRVENFESRGQGQAQASAMAVEEVDDVGNRDSSSSDEDLTMTDIQPAKKRRAQSAHKKPNRDAASVHVSSAVSASQGSRQPHSHSHSVETRRACILFSVYFSRQSSKHAYKLRPSVCYLAYVSVLARL